MKKYAALRRSPAFERLTAVSECLGRDPLQVQGPGGNTSLKGDGAMWIKASGTWLADAREREIMVPVDLAALRRAIDNGDIPDDACVAHDINPDGLRASIETSVHAVLDWPAVLHTHCVATIAMSVRDDAEAELARRLADFDVCFIPYIKPGWDLARSIKERIEDETRVLVLGNHGLVACGETVDEAHALLRTVSERLGPASIAPGMDPPEALQNRLAGTSWAPAPDAITHAIALDPARLGLAAGATLYPDHIILLGPGVAVAREDEPPDDAAARAAAGGPPKKLMLFPGMGAAIPSDASAGVKALARCLGEVLARIEPGVTPTRFTAAQEAELLNWDAEKYRQSLDKSSAQ